MQIRPLSISSSDPANEPRRTTRGSQGAFQELSRVNLQRSAPVDTQNQAAREAAGQLVAAAFIKPLLAQVHKSPFGSELFHGGSGERMFQDHLDTILADRITQRTGFGIADQIYRHVARLPRVVDHSDGAGSASPRPVTLHTHG